MTEELDDQFYRKSQINRAYLQEYSISNALDKTIRKMKKMETSEVELRSFEETKYGSDKDALGKYFQKNGLEFNDEFFKTPKNSVKYTVTMYFFAEGKHLYTIKSDERREFVNRKKALAAKLMKEERFKQAVKVLEILIEYSSMGIYAEDKALFRDDLLSGYLNCSLCFWKLDKWPKMQMAADKALEVDPKSVKAAYRKAFALRKLQDYDEALKFLKDHPQLESDELTTLKQGIEADLKKHREKEKEIYKDMFSK